eukprot:2863452-Pyramimonas_sp.AAC.1
MLFRAKAPRGPGIAARDPVLPFTAGREGDWAPSQGQRKRRGRGGETDQAGKSHCCQYQTQGSDRRSQCHCVSRRSPWHPHLPSG